MTDETETPVLAALTEVLAPTHEPAPTPIPPDTTLTLPSGETIPLRDLLDDQDYPVFTPTDEDEGCPGCEACGDDEELLDKIWTLTNLMEEISAILKLHGIALNEILHALTPPQRKAKAKAKAKPAKAKPPKAKPAKRKTRT